MVSPILCLLVTGEDALKEFQLFVRSLEVWHPDAQLYVYTDSATRVHSVKTKCALHIKNTMDAYKGCSRKMMEASPGKIYDSQFKDYTYEKANAMAWAFAEEKDAGTNGVWFCDADITMLAPLPAIPEGANLALSPHYIREVDCGMFGKYNAGFLWIKETKLIDKWREAGHRSRFFEQAALEDVAKEATLYEFPSEVNFGWWRMFQAPAAPVTIQAKFSIHRPDTSVGIRYDGKPLQSVHTHWHEKTSATGAFNVWFVSFANRFKAHKPVQQLLSSIEKSLK